jgi:hypothetical protein
VDTLKLEKGPESIPTREDVVIKFNELIKGGYILNLDKELKDEQGLLQLEANAPEKSETGEYTQYIYMRKGHHSLTTTIVSADYKDGKEIYGETVSEYIDGVWK